MMNNQEYIYELLTIWKTNPNLDVMCKVDSDIVAEDGYAWWLGKINTRFKVEIDEYTTNIGDNVKFKSDADYEDWYEQLGYDYDDIDNDDEIIAIVDKDAKWKKAIFISITTK